MSLLNGEQKDDINIADRGFQYGDGVFETIEVIDGRPLFLDRHLKRLENACCKILIPAPDITLLAEESWQLSSPCRHGVLKIIVTRGSGGRGYRQPPHIIPTRLLSIYPYPDYPEQYQTQGITVRFCQNLLSSNPALAGIKHMNRLEQILARAEWQDETIQEGLMLDSQARVIEGTMSNLFLVKNRKLFTPELSKSGVAGIVRAIVMELARQQDMGVEEIHVDKSSLLQADEVFVTNSVIGIWPVKQIEQQYFNIGPITRSLQNMFQQMRIVST